MPDVTPLLVPYDVRGYDCGYGGPIRPFALSNYLQEAAGYHATSLGVGVEHLMENGMTWMLSKTDVRVDESPVEGERILVETWPIGLERLFALRCFRVKREDGSVLARAVYAYLVVDVAARRPVRPEKVLPPGLSCPEPCPVADRDFSMPDAESAALRYALRARPRHVDHNGHVNNAHIVDWLADAASDASDLRSVDFQSVDLRSVDFQSADLRSEGDARTHRGLDRMFAGLAVEFRAEILSGDDIEAYSAATPDGAIVAELRRSGQIAARGRFRPA